MLPRSKRLNLKKDFKWVASGKKIENKLLKLFLKEGDNESPRIGVAVSAKVFRTAVSRNRAKRITSAAFTSLFHALPKNINIVALPKVSILNVKSSDVLLDLEEKLIGEKIIS